jgi:hypothetical protein
MEGHPCMTNSHRIQSLAFENVCDFSRIDGACGERLQWLLHGLPIRLPRLCPCIDCCWHARCNYCFSNFEVPNNCKVPAAILLYCLTVMLRFEISE